MVVCTDIVLVISDVIVLICVFVVDESTDMLVTWVKNPMIRITVRGHLSNDEQYSRPMSRLTMETGRENRELSFCCCRTSFCDSGKVCGDARFDKGDSIRELVVVSTSVLRTTFVVVDTFETV